MAAAHRRFRFLALLFLGALLVHHLRYAVQYGDGWREALGEHGHGYLALVLPLVALAVLAAVAGFAIDLRRAHRHGQAQQSAPASLARTWLLAAAALSAVYAGQELLEVTLSADHGGSLGALVAGGGWAAFPIALGVALGVALLMRGADEVVRRAALRELTPVRVRPHSSRRYAGVDLPSLEVVARHLAARAPPAASS